MRLLVLQHHAVEHPGVFRRLLAAAGIACEVVRLDRGEALPPVAGYDGLWVFGGTMDVWEEDEHPWLVAEKAAIRQAVRDLGLPFLGVCLGHQLLADALGGRVAPMPSPEIGVFEVELLPEAERDPLFGGAPRRFAALHGHGAAVTALPEGAVILARSAVCGVQAMRWGERAWGIQYHCEAEPETLAAWCGLPDYRAWLERHLGEAGPGRLAAEAEREMGGFAAHARRLFDAFSARLIEASGAARPPMRQPTP